MQYIECPFCNYNRVIPTNKKIEQCIQNGHKALINYLYAICPYCGRAWNYKDVWERILTMQDIEEVKWD